jgi:hypothetical protein
LAASGFCGVWAGPIAGKPAPTGFSVDLEMCEQQKNCGSWLASDGANNFKKYQPLVLEEAASVYGRFSAKPD